MSGFCLSRYEAAGLTVSSHERCCRRCACRRRARAHDSQGPVCQGSELGTGRGAPCLWSRSGRAPDHQTGRKFGSRRNARAAADQADQFINGPHASIIQGLAHCRQARRHRRCGRHIVEPADRDVRRNFKTKLDSSVQSPHCHGIVGAEDGGGRIGQCQQ